MCEKQKESKEEIEILTESENELNPIDDEQIAKRLQIELEAENQANKLKLIRQQQQQQSDEMMAQKLQIEHERERLKLERQEMENERAAMFLYEQEQKGHIEYLQKKKDEEERSKMLIEMEQNRAMDEQSVMDLFRMTVRNRRIVSVQSIAKNAKNEIYEAILAEKIKKSNGGKSRNEIERYLWHGTKNINNINLIINNGFDRSYNRTMGFGKGTYFARDASYSVNGYCGADVEGIFYILLCKVIVGEYTRGSQTYTAIPKKPDHTEYDSMVNCERNPSIFVIWRDYHACPTHLVKFR